MHRAVGIGNASVFTLVLQRYRDHRAVANIAEHLFRTLPTDKNNILDLKSSLRHRQELNLFFALLSTAVCR
jgi:hypothetical protein